MTDHNSAPTAQPASARRLSLTTTFSSLRHRNYRLWFAGQLVSLVGTWMQSTAQGFLVYELTRSPAYLGYVGFAAGIPSWLFTLYGGVIADRMSRRALLVMTQSYMMVLAFVLAWLAGTGRVQAWHIVGLAFMLGIGNAFDAPARQAFVRELVAREDMINAIALNSTMFNSATAVGPAVAGLAYAALGPTWCFIINGLSFVAVISALLLMRIRPVEARPEKTSALQEIKIGLKYVAHNIVVRTGILNLVAISLFGMSFATLFPAWAVKVLGGDAATNGFLQSARGVGAVIGALMIAALGSFIPRGRLLTIGGLAMPLLLLVFANLRWLPLSLLTLVGLGWAFMTLANSTNALVQMQVPDELRGRVMGIFTLSFFGFMPLGSLIAGNLASWVGEPDTIMLGASLLLIVWLWIWLRVPQLRRAG